MVRDRVARIAEVACRGGADERCDDRLAAAFSSYDKDPQLIGDERVRQRQAMTVDIQPTWAVRSWVLRLVKVMVHPFA